MFLQHHSRNSIPYGQSMIGQNCPSRLITRWHLRDARWLARVEMPLLQPRQQGRFQIGPPEAAPSVDRSILQQRTPVVKRRKTHSSGSRLTHSSAWHKPRFRFRLLSRRRGQLRKNAAIVSFADFKSAGVITPLQILSMMFASDCARLELRTRGPNA